MATTYETFTGLKAKAGIRPHSSHDLAEIYARHDGLKRRIEDLHCFEIDKFGYALS